jgi:Integrase core domain
MVLKFPRFRGHPSICVAGVHNGKKQLTLHAGVSASGSSWFGPGEELLARSRFKTQAEARNTVFQFIEGFYNPRRRHSSLEYLSPVEFERRHREAADAPRGTRSCRRARSRQAQALWADMLPIGKAHFFDDGTSAPARALSASRAQIDNLKAIIRAPAALWLVISDVG